MSLTIAIVIAVASGWCGWRAALQGATPVSVCLGFSCGTSLAVIARILAGHR